MYTDLGQFDKAKQYLVTGGRGGGRGGGGSVGGESRELLNKQAEWVRDTNDPHTAW